MSQHAAAKSAQPVQKKPAVHKKNPLRKAKGPSGPVGKSLVQAKVEVHESDDQYEQEADRVADMIVGMSLGGAAEGGADSHGSEDSKSTVPGRANGAVQRAAEDGDDELQAAAEDGEFDEIQAATDDGPVQRKCAECEAEEDLQASFEEESGVRSLGGEVAIQRECATCAAEESEELQLDSDEACTPVQRACATCDGDVDEDVQRSNDEPVQEVQAKCATCEQEGELQREEDEASRDQGSAVQTAAEDGEDDVQAAGAQRSKKKAPQPGAGFEQKLSSAKQGGGVALPTSVREFMEPRFGASFEGVRVHTDSAAHELTRSVGARAFATGKHLFFKQGAFQPHSHSGRHLIAHELTHVLQQRGGLHHVAIQREEDDELEGEVEVDPPVEEMEDAEVEEPEADLSETGEEGGAEASAGGQGLVVNSVRQFEPGEPSPRAPTSASDAGAVGAEVTAPGSGAVSSASSAIEEAIKGEPASADTVAEGSSGGTSSDSSTGYSSVRSLIGPGDNLGAKNANHYTEGAEEPEEELDEPAEDNQQVPTPDKDVKEETFDVDEPDNCPAEEKKEGVDQAEPPADTSAGAKNLPTPAAAAKATRQAADQDKEGLEAELTPIEQGIVDAEMKRGQAVEEYSLSAEEASLTQTRAEGLLGDVRFREEEGPDNEEVLRAGASTTDFFNGASEKFGGLLSAAQASIPARVGAAAEMAKAGLGEAIESQKTAVSDRIQAARVEAYGAAAHARSRIHAQASEYISTVETQTQAANAVMTKAHQAASEQLTQQKDTALDQVNSTYKKGHEDMVEVSRLVGQEARSIGNKYILAYSRGPKGIRAAYDGFWQGYLTRRRAVAQVNATKETTDGYQENLEKSGRKQALEIARAGRREDRCNVISAGAQFQEGLNSGLSGTQAALLTNKTNAISQAKSARDGMLASINAALASTLTQLDKQEVEQRQAINDTGYLQQVTIEQAAHATSAALLKSVTDGVDQAVSGFEQMRAQLQGSAAPDPEQLQLVLAEAEMEVETGTTEMASILETSTGGAMEQLGQIQTKGAEALTQITTSNDELATGVNEGFSQSMGGIVANATNSFASMTTSFSQQVQDTARAGAAGFTKSTTGMREYVEKQKKAAEAKIEDGAKQIAANLREQLPQLQEDIPKQANRAAAKEPPAWKQMLAVLIIIIVVIAIIAVTILTAGAGLGLVAVLAIGAGMGAATSALIAIATNLWSNQPWHKGVLKAAAIGAITGFLGAGVGAGVGALLSKAAPLVQHVVGFVADLGFDAVVTFVQGGFSFEQATWGEFFLNLGIMVGTTLLGLGAARHNAKMKLRLEADVKLKAQADAKLKAEADAKTKAEADAQAKAEADAKAKAEAEAQAKAEADARAKAEADAKAKAEAEAQAKAEAEARAKAEAEAEAQARAEAEAKKAETEANSDNGGQTNTETPAQRRKRLKEKMEAQRAERREATRQKILDEAISAADAKMDASKLDPGDAAFLNADRRHKELAIDVDGNGSYRVDEARAAIRAEADGVLPKKVRRALKGADPNESGGDFVDGSGKVWDHKSASMGADDIAATANGKMKENVLVDARDMSPAQRAALEAEVRTKLKPDSGDVRFVPKGADSGTTTRTGGTDGPNGRTNTDPDTGPTGRTQANDPDVGPNKMTADEARVLDSTANKNGNELTPSEVQTERAVARRGKTRAIDEPPYTSEADLPNDHKLKDSEGSGVKRCSDKCGIYDESGKLIGQEAEGARKNPTSDTTSSESGGEPPVTSKITDSEATTLSPEEVSARVREGHASDWAVDPKTGKFDPKRKMQGLSPDEVDVRARDALARKRAGQPETEPMPDPVRRRMRHLENSDGKPMPMKDWAEAGNRINVNRDISRGPEIKAIQASGGSRANVGDGRKSFTRTERVDANGRPSRTGTKEKTVTTVPDGTRKNSGGGFDVLEHKHFTGDDSVLHDSAQLRAQRKLASSPEAQQQVFGSDVTPGAKGKHEIVMTSEKPIVGDADPSVRPSTPLGEKTDLIRYFDLKQNRFTHKWDPDLGSWTPLP